MSLEIKDLAIFQKQAHQERLPQKLEIETKEMLTAMTIGITLLVVFIALPLMVNFDTKNTAQALAESKLHAEKLLVLANDERNKAGLKSLILNKQLETAAQNKAASMVRENYFSHTSPSGEKFVRWIKEAKYKYEIAGENLASDFSENQAIVDAWMASPAHKANILNPLYTDTAIAVQNTNDQRKAVVVELFGKQNE